MARPDDIVTLETLHDPIEAEMRVEILRSAGIDAEVPGLEHRQMLGVLGAYVPLPLRVRREDAAHAREILEGLEDPDALLEAPVGDPVPPAGEGPYRGGEAVDSSYRDQRLKRVAAFCALVLPGTAHFYARESTTGWVLLGLQVSALALGMTFAPAFLAAVPVVLAYDFVGSLRACDRFNRGEPRAPGAQLARSPLAIAMAGAAVFAAPHLAPYLDDEAVERDSYDAFYGSY